MSQQTKSLQFSASTLSSCKLHAQGRGCLSSSGGKGGERNCLWFGDTRSGTLRGLPRKVLKIHELYASGMSPKTGIDTEIRPQSSNPRKKYFPKYPGRYSYRAPGTPYPDMLTKRIHFAQGRISSMKLHPELSPPHPKASQFTGLINLLLCPQP